MNAGMQLNDLAAELTRRLASKHDYRTPTGRLKLAYQEPDKRFTLTLGEAGEFQISKLGHDQMAAWADIPTKYYSRMLATQPQLLIENMQTWFRAKQSMRMVRTMDGRMRAFLSDAYRIVDSYDVAEAVLPVLAESGAVIRSTNVDDHNMYIKATWPRLQAEVKLGDVVEMGVSIRCNEVGQGKAEVAPYINRLICMNGAVIPDAGLAQYHLGPRSGESDNVWEVLRDETKALTNRALMAKFADVTRAACDETKFRGVIDRMKESSKDKIAADPGEVVEVVSDHWALTPGERKGVLANLVNDTTGAGFTRWGIGNAITQIANTETDYDRCTALERIGGEIITMPSNDFAAITQSK